MFGNPAQAQQQGPFGMLASSGALGALGAGLLSGPGTQGIMAGFGNATQALQAHQAKQAQQKAMQGILSGGGLTPQQAAYIKSLPPAEAMKMLGPQLFPKFNKDQELLKALSDPSHPLHAAAQVQYGTRADADTVLTQKALNERHSTVSADAELTEGGRQSRFEIGQENEMRQFAQTHNLDLRKLALRAREVGHSQAMSEARMELDRDKFDRGIVEFDTTFQADEAERLRQIEIASIKLEQAQQRIEQGDRSENALNEYRKASLAVQQMNAETGRMRAENPSPLVTVNNGGTNFKVPKGFMRDPADPGRVVPIPGSEEERTRQESEAERISTLDSARQALDVIAKARAHPGRAAGTGVTGVLPPIPGTAQGDFVRLNDQLQGKAFLQAFESLKGGGQITEIEGRKATDAIARLQRTQSEEGYLAALKDLEDVVRAGIVRSERAGTAPLDVGQSRTINGVTIRRKD